MEPQGYGGMIKIKESQLAALQAELKEMKSASSDDCSHLEGLETAWEHHQAVM